MLKKQDFFDFSEKTVLLTGAASGIGKSTALLLSSFGAKLILLDINTTELQKTADLCENALCVSVDLSDLATLKSKVEDAVKIAGPVDAMVHIAGIPCLSPLKILSMETAEKVLRVNTLAALELSKIFSKHKNYKGDFPSVIYISSVYGLVGSAANVAYAMSKSALHGIAKSLSVELASKKIRVNCIAPGFIKTEMLDNVAGSFDSEYDERLNALHPLGLGTADDIAQTVSFLVSDMSKWITGSIISVDGGFTAQ